MLSCRRCMWVLVSLAISLFPACGGSDSGGGGTVTSSAITYTGNTAPAVIDELNAKRLVALAYSGPEVEVVTPLAQGGGQTAASPLGEVLDLNRKLADEISRDLTGAFEIQPMAVFSGCLEGSVVESPPLADTEAGTLTYTFEFIGCVDGDQRFDGVAIGTVNVDFPDPGDPQQITLPDPLTTTMNYQNLNVRNLASEANVTVHGEVIVVTDASTDTVDMTMNMVVRDELASNTWKLEGYRVVLTVVTNYLQVDIRGRVFDPVAGYVDVSTLDPILEELTGPSQGVLHLDGANGSWAEVDFGIVCDPGTATYNGSFVGDGEFCYP